MAERSANSTNPGEELKRIGDHTERMPPQSISSSCGRVLGLWKDFLILCGLGFVVCYYYDFL